MRAGEERKRGGADGDGDGEKQCHLGSRTPAVSRSRSGFPKYVADDCGTVA